MPMYWRDRHSRLRGLRKVSVNPAVWKTIYIVAGIALILVVVYFGPIFLVQGKLSAVDRLKATSDARTSLATVVTAAGLAAGLFFTARTFMLSRTGQNTDRYQACIKQLGDECLTVRIGGIYALERLAQDTAWTRQTISDVLVSFISGNTKAGYLSPPADIQAALTVLGRHVPGVPLRPLNLSGAILTGAHLQGAQLKGAQLKETQLQDAGLTDACLQRAAMQDAKLPGADLSNANLKNADLTNADLRNAKLYQTDFDKATLTGCYLAGCDLSSARNLSESQCADARLTDSAIPPSRASETSG